MWNNLNLKCPVEDLCQYTLHDGTILQELSTLVHFLKVSAEVLNHNHPLWEEIKVFRNVQYKYRRILNSDKGVRLLLNVGTYLRKIALLKLHKTYLDLAKQFDNFQSQSLPILLPSCQQLEYVLLRTQAAAKLICVALHFSKEAFCYLIQSLRMGRLILILMMAISATARVNIMFRDILVQIFDNYKKLYIWREKLKKGIAEWPKPLDLPEDLETWLNPEASDLLKPPEVPEGQAGILSSFFEKENKFVEPIGVYNINDDEHIIGGEKSQSQLENFDIGEVIPRPDKCKKKRKRDLTESKILLLEQIQNAKSLKKLKSIWNQLYTDPQVLLGEALSPNTSRVIEKLFLLARKKFMRIKHSDVAADIKGVQKTALIQSIGKKLAKHLLLIESKLTESELSTSSTSNSVLSVEELKPVKKLKELRLLYNTLHQMLQSTQQYKKCDKLQKMFKNRRTQIKQLFLNDEKKIAKKLIFETSKEILTSFSK